ncbi:MAG TPA: DUF2127 domain-containing protein [Steroidobacteraceae bacterium]|nr:DUF2127 domain-containing protein [Steroidobacteraceae bacterium]
MTNGSLPPPRSLGLLRAIAAFKFGKAAFVIATGLALLRFYDPQVNAMLLRLAHDLPYAFEQHLMRDAIAFLSGMSPRQIQIIAAASFSYSALFLVEGVGLWMGLHWAEILTVVATSSLVPVEIYEIFHRFTPAKVLVLVANLGIVSYLIWRLRRESAVRRVPLAPGSPTH